MKNTMIFICIVVYVLTVILFCFWSIDQKSEYDKKIERVNKTLDRLEQTVLSLSNGAIVHDCSSQTVVREAKNEEPKDETGEEQSDFPVKNQDKKENQSK